ncbi:MAG TPA: primosomal protein N' [Desulfurivibrio alkaliphilus]|uniref:Replication restart protein PriA n=1 Tax=Desulfurivibrio alkaliphilus TaxID=427923 RepID=A0A7C2XNA2_9BACT|nr:primosomal protein N' [Desulfurivibrio alkaliphilus]
MSQDPALYFEVAVLAPIHHTLTYAPPPGVGRLAPGHRLLVPLGRRQLTGYLLACSTTPPVVKPGEKRSAELREIAADKIRAALAVLDPEPLFPAALVPFFRWIADYYHHPIGDVIQTALPAGLNRRSVNVIKLTPEGAKALANHHQTDEAPEWLEELLAAGELSPAQSAAIIRRRQPSLGRWQKQGWLQVISRLKLENVRPKCETVVMLPKDTPPPLSRPLKPAEEKTLALARKMAGDNAGGLPRRELVKEYAGAGRVLKNLAALGLVELVERRLYRDPFGEPPPFFAKPARLTGEQEGVMAQLLPAIQTGGYAPFLLHGITGSGKTEIYLRAAEVVLAQGRQVLVLVPEIALATQLEGHFCSRFGEAVALLHSGLSAGERFDQWSRLLGGEAQIAIGARSAIFAPLPDPGLIIVDEEHDPAYKQEEQLRYNARDLALLRGLQQRATVILGSATPAVSSYYQAQKGKFRLLTMGARIDDRPLPAVEVIDLKEVKTVSGYPPLFSPQLVRALKENLAAGHQSLVFLNRRGWANLMLCKDCGRPVQCQHCQVSLTLHKQRGQLLCHHCGYHLPRDLLCPNCRSGTLVSAGFGTERLEEELRRLLPKARIARLDQDTTRDRGQFLKVLKAVRDLEIDILIGTQMITKGHHFPRVTLVGIVWADAGLGIPDYKAGERTFQLLTQVTGRAGRGEFPGRVLIQTLQADHYSVTMAQNHDYQGLYQQEIAQRRRLNFPPLGRLINLRLDGEQEERVRELASSLGELALRLSGGRIAVLGPSPAPLARLRGRYRWQLLLKGSGVEELHRLCRRICAEYPRLPGASTVKLSLDVDPENMV